MSRAPAQVIVPRETLDSWIRGECSLGECSVASGELAPKVPDNAARRTLPRSLLRSLPRAQPPRPPARRPQDGHAVRLFSANDYLGLSAHPRVREAASRAALAVGNGPRASALVSGYTHEHRALETTLAALKGAEECLLFPTGARTQGCVPGRFRFSPHTESGRCPPLCAPHLPDRAQRAEVRTPQGARDETQRFARPAGFAANLSVLTALAGQEDCEVFSDELNHASIVDGARQAARGRVRIYRHSDVAHLEALLLESTARRKLVVTDTLFSMDGTH